MPGPTGYLVMESITIEERKIRSVVLIDAPPISTVLLSNTAPIGRGVRKFKDTITISMTNYTIIRVP